MRASRIRKRPMATAPTAIAPIAPAPRANTPTASARMAVLPEFNRPKALAVYRIHHTTFQGLRFFVDDLVTEEAARGQGFGSALLDWCVGKARAGRCDTFALDSGVQRTAAHRFYFRHGLVIRSFAFSKDIR